MDENKKKEPTSMQEILNGYESNLPKRRALELCSNHFGQSWNKITEEDIDLSVIRGGFCNQIFLCHNKKSKDKVLIRLYGGRMGNLNNQKHIGLEGEVLIFHLMDKCGIGPKLLGVFDGGRIEEFIEGANTLSDEDCVNNEKMGSFAKKLATMHSQNIPFSKKPRDMIKIIRSNILGCWDNYKELLKNGNSRKEVQNNTGRILTLH